MQSGDLQPRRLKVARSALTEQETRPMGLALLARCSEFSKGKRPQSDDQGRSEL